MNYSDIFLIVLTIFCLVMIFVLFKFGLKQREKEITEIEKYFNKKN
ncbi:MAG: hypothetical protein PHQ98_00700 [Candidatus ainarchaeum sp.]|nr:hypothetical protein [Candidatus ainarchaeum sp.]